MMVAYCHRSEITLRIIHVDLDIENSDNKFMLISPHNKFIKNVSSPFFHNTKDASFFAGYD